MADKKIFLIGGGTGGHVIPVYRLYRKLAGRQGIVAFVIGSGSPIEEIFFNDLSNYRRITAGKLHRSFTLRNLQELLYFLIGMVRSLVLLVRLRPTLIFSKGGFVALPFILWARVLKIPYFIHESDIVMGATNRLATSGATMIFTGFPQKYYQKKVKKEAVFTGQLIDFGPVKKGVFDFGFDHKPVIFFAGGSQGSLKLNRCLFRCLPELLQNYNIIHQSGFLGYDEVLRERSKLSDNHKKSYFIKDFLGPVGETDLMGSALARADLVVSRAGATSIAEFAGASKAMLLIPYRYASANHQQKNAEALKKAGAAEVLLEKELTPIVLTEKINELFSDVGKRRELARNAVAFFPKDGLEIVYKEITAFMKG